MSDVEISRKVVGDWTVSGSSGNTQVRSDGSFVADPPTDTNVTAFPKWAGLWYIKDGFYIKMITNVFDSKGYDHTIINVERRYKIIRIDDHQMVIRPEGHTNLITILKH